MRRALLALGLAALAPAAAHGNPIDAFGFGARAPAMAGAQTASSRDAGANYYNPALVAGVEHLELEIGYQLALPSLALNGHDLDVDSSRGLAIGIGAPGRIGPVELAIGTALFLPDHHATRIRFLESGQPRFVQYDNRPQRLLMAASIAARLGSRVALGIGLGYMADTTGSVALAGLIGFPDPESSDLALAIDIDVPPIEYPQAGVAVELTDWLTAGASFRGGFDLDVDLSIGLVGDIGAPGRDPVVEDGSLSVDSLAKDLFQPEQWSAGLAAQVTPALLVDLDATWARWSAFENPASRINAELDAGEFNDLIDLPDATDVDDPGFSDILIARLGAEYTVRRAHHDVALRAGYAFEPSPAPEQTGKENFADSDKHTMATGVGLTVRDWSDVVRGPVRIDLFVALIVLEDRDHHKLSPIDPVGDYVSSGHLVSLGLMSSWSF